MTRQITLPFSCALRRNLLAYCLLGGHKLVAYSPVEVVTSCFAKLMKVLLWCILYFTLTSIFDNSFCFVYSCMFLVAQTHLVLKQLLKARGLLVV